MLVADVTPLKTNMEPKNQSVEKENHIPNLHFLVLFQGVNTDELTLDLFFHNTLNR